MPYAPMNKKCRELGCNKPKTRRSTFCEDHGGELSDKMIANKKLYLSKAWAKQRIIQLSKSPLCACCLLNGKVVEALHIDHVFPHRQDPMRFKINLFQSLCASCHTLKTQSENKGIYLYYGQKGVIEYKEEDYKPICYGTL